MRPTYSILGTGAVAAGVAETALAVRGGAAFGLDLRKWGVAFDGVTASAVPALIELCHWSGATTGTSTAATPVQVAGRTVAHGVGGSGQNFTVEPTILTPVKQLLLTPNGGLFVEEFDKDAGFDSGALEGFAIRITAAAIVNYRALLEWCRA